MGRFLLNCLVVLFQLPFVAAGLLWQLIVNGWSCGRELVK